MYKTTSFKKKILATAIASAAVAVTFNIPAYAQDGAVEEVTVTGIRASLQRSMDQKRTASGVQDVISAEDIGKFPDTNLAESMQRIPGVSINREGGEGSRVTVRGLGAEYNLVTQNGRTIAKTTGDRSFNFADMAAELVAGVAVAKTSSAILDSGGMGATIDIRSIRPLNNPGQKAILSGKLISDTSWAGGDTPEVFGLYSNTFADDTIGVSVAIDYQKRESSLARAMVDNGWKTFDGDDTSAANSPEGGIYSLPQSARYKFERDERERLNGQLVLQWAPTEDVKATLDYDTYERSVHSDRNEVSAWFTYPNSGRVGAWTTNNGVSSPLIYSENYVPIGGSATPNDLSMAGGLFAHKYTGDTIGLNVDWQVNDRLKLVADIATSDAEDAPDSKYGSDANLSTAALTRTSTSIDFTGEIFSVINGGGDARANQMQVTGSVFGNLFNTSSVDQYQLKGNFIINDESNIDFGIASTEVFNRYRQINVQQNGWGGLGTPGQMADAFTGSDANLRSRFDGSFGNFGLASGLPGGATLADGTNLNSATVLNHFFDWDFDKVHAKATSLYNTPANQAGVGTLGDCGDGKPSIFCASTDYEKGTDRRTSETTDAFYAQYNFERGIFKANLGARYETTDVVSTAASSLYTGTNWGADTEISFTGQTAGYTTKTASYSRFLPNLDLSFDVSDDVLLRTSVSKSIARPSYTDIAGGVSVEGNFPRTSGYANGSQGNPSLSPYESINVDFSAEWYFDDVSYASFGLFSKKISNFIANETVSVDGRYAPEMPILYNPYESQYVRDAIAAGQGASGQSIRTWIFANRNGQPGVTKSTTAGAPSYAGSIVGQPSDGQVEFRMSTPTNSGDDRELMGYEFAVQHMFGETGFGGQLNYTAVLTDLSWDVTSRSQDQRPLLGVSDSANLVGLYEENGWNVRVAYNWRDKFLTNYNDEGNQSPQFVRPYYQIDLGVSYEVTDNIKISLDGINVTENDYEIVARTDGQLLRHDEYGARWVLGASYSF